MPKNDPLNKRDSLGKIRPAMCSWLQQPTVPVQGLQGHSLPLPVTQNQHHITMNLDSKAANQQAQNSKSKRHFVGQLLLSTAACSLGFPHAARAQTSTAAQASQADAQAQAALNLLARRAGGRLGVNLLNCDTGAQLGLLQNEAFALCSTFKLPLAALILKAVDDKLLRADQWVPIRSADIEGHAPVSKTQLAAGGMRLLDLAKAAQMTSDNTASNLLVQLLGGEAAVTAKLRALGDAHTRLDRPEPAMNLVPTGEMRDTTTPQAMSHTVAKMVCTPYLSAGSQATLRSWMEATTTGAKRLRAGLPANWPSGDKTGTGMARGMPDKYNDVAVAWPAGRAPLVIAGYFEPAGPPGPAWPQISNAAQQVLADVGRIAAQWHSQS